MPTESRPAVPPAPASAPPGEIPSVRRLRLLGVVEGISWLLLLCVAMPLKYAADMPLAVSVVGAVHGALFTLFVYLLFVAHMERRWSVGFSGSVFLSGLLPFGFLWIDRRLRPAPATP